MREMWVAIHSMRSPVPGVRRTPRDEYHRSDRRVRPCRPPRQHQAPRLARRGSRCGVCAGTATTGSRYCVNCVSTVNRENLLEQAKLGRIAIHSPSAEARRSATQRKQFDAIRKWNPSELPDWLNEKAYRRESLPRLSKFTVKAICLALDVSHPYATNIRRGTVLPQRRRPKVSSRR